MDASSTTSFRDSIHARSGHDSRGLLGRDFALLAPIILVESAHLGMVVSGYREAHYSVADPVSRIAFAPIHFVDSRIRSDYWGPYSDF